MGAVRDCRGGAHTGGDEDGFRNLSLGGAGVGGIGAVNFQTVSIFGVIAALIRVLLRLL